jgi:hypothetical protein
MENGDTKNSDGKAPGDLSPSAAKTETRKQQRKSNTATNKPRKQQKWSLVRHWKAANRTNQAKWFLEGFGALIAVSVLGVYIWSNLQTKWNFQAEHEPLISYKNGECWRRVIDTLHYEVDHRDYPSKQLHVWDLGAIIENSGNVSADNVINESQARIRLDGEPPQDAFKDNAKETPASISIEPKGTALIGIPSPFDMGFTETVMFGRKSE